MTAGCFVPSHAAATGEIAPLAQLNIDTILEVADTIRGMLNVPVTFEDLLANVFDAYHLTMSLQQRVLVGSTVKSYLSYLKDGGQAAYLFENNRMLWQSV